jgi:alanyl-tRNA synthetase
VIYFDDPYRTRAGGTVTRGGNDDRGEYAVLERSLFYPQGGGQKGDRGALSGSGRTVAVTDTRTVGGEVRVYLDGPASGGDVEQELDWDFRYHQMRLHSAAHFLHCALERQAGGPLPHPVRAPLSETVGECHYGFTDRFDGDGLAAAVESMNADTARGHAISTRPAEELGPGFRTWHSAGHTVPCGGLHPATSAEIGPVTASMRVKRGKTLVTFGLR